MPTSEIEGASWFRPTGTIIGKFDGGTIYSDGIQHGSIGVSANLFGYSFGLEYDTFSSKIGPTRSKTVSKNGFSLDVDAEGNIKAGKQVGYFDGGILTYTDGSKGFYAGVNLNSKMADIGISIDSTFASHTTYLSSYNAATMYANGTVYKTEYRAINKTGFDSGIAAYTTVYTPNRPPKEFISPVSHEFAAQMAAGLADHGGRCFASGTAILMGDNLEKPIETIRPGDLVASFDETADGGRGALVPKRVVRTFANENQIVIDLHGTRVTPGHAYLCGDGPHEGRFRQIMTIVCDDGAVVLADGTLMRAATGCPVGSIGDAMLEIQIARPARNKLTGKPVTLLKERGRIRAGTRLQRPDGSFFSFLDLIETKGWTLHDDGLVSQGPDHPPEPLLWAGATTPRPEDYILALSQLTLADLYDDPHQLDMPQGRPGHMQGEANAVLLHAAASQDDDRGAETASPSLKRRLRDLVDLRRAKRTRAPRHAGDIIH